MSEVYKPTNIGIDILILKLTIEKYAHLGFIFLQMWFRLLLSTTS